jgi:hypothetical protein
VYQNISPSDSRYMIYFPQAPLIKYSSTTVGS